MHPALPALLALVTLLAASRAGAVAQEEHTSNWAVLVSTSRYWLNYRHIVNTMSMYHVVKRLGIPDSNIILMVADDMACNARNSFPAQLFNDPAHGLDVYGQDVEVDYRGYELTVSSFLQVMTGRHEAGVPRSKRLMSDAGSNVLVYLSGHGGDEFMKFQDVQELLAQDVADAVQQMHQKSRYREMMIIVETCQAATLLQRITAPNVVAIACSQKDQQSLSHGNDPVVGLSLIDRFTYQTLAFLEELPLSSSATLADLLKTYNPAFLGAQHSTKPIGFDRPVGRIKLTDFFGAVAAVQQGTKAAPQDSHYHGDYGLARDYAAHVLQNDEDELDALLRARGGGGGGADSASTSRMIIAPSLRTRPVYTPQWEPSSLLLLLAVLLMLACACVGSGRPIIA